jgi:xanthine dehydrogenase small subunit
MASCLVPLGELAGKHVLTIDGLGPELTPPQKALYQRFGAQCGFCTPGFVMSLTGFFLSSPHLSEEDALDCLDGNICRCTGYVPIIAAARDLSREFSEKLKGDESRISRLVEWGVIPSYCMDMEERLRELDPGGSRPSEHAPLIAGGTDLYIQQGPTLETAADVRLISDTKARAGVTWEGEDLVIGAATTVEDMRLSPELHQVFPSLGEDLKLVASTILRNRATVAGNLVNASPIADMAIVLLALDARLVLTAEAERTIPLAEFFHGYKKINLEPGEVVTRIVLPDPRGRRFHFEKVCKRRILDIATVNTAISVRMDGETMTDVRVSAGGVAPVPLLLESCGQTLSGQEPSAELAVRAADRALAEISPISDVRGGADYKAELLRRLLYAHFLELFPQQTALEVLL